MKNKLRGASADAILLMLIKLVTIALGFVVTRLLSQHLSVYDYGTYSQVQVVISTVTTLTILGMMDGVNYFYCSEPDVGKREAYISTIFTMQCLISAAAGSVVLLLSEAICAGFHNPDVKRLLIFAAGLPLMQNLLSMIQVLLISIGKARMLALRNLTVSLIRLAAVIVVVTLVQNVAVILLTTFLLDAVQIGLFGFILGKNGCKIHLRSTNFRLIKEILRFCAPMAVFTAISALNRDIDKYLIALMTDTETLAIYSNASKVLPFDIIMTSFCTVLLPEITRQVSAGEKTQAASLYRLFLEIAYISTAILCCGAFAVSPQLMRLLYSEKYLSGLGIFCIYILVDLLRFTNITMVLSAAGKTKKLMFLGVGALAVNAVLNVVLFWWMGMIGPAVATLLTTLGTGLWILNAGAKELGTTIGAFFDWKVLLVFTSESGILTAILAFVQQWLAGKQVPYLLILVGICGIYGICMVLLQGKRLLAALKNVNKITKKQ